MLKRGALVLGLLLLVAASTPGDEPDPSAVTYKKSGDLKWVAIKEYPGVSTAVLAGDPSQPGPYVVRWRFERNSFTKPHFHSRDELVAVVVGTYYIGTGVRWDTILMAAMEPGTFITNHAGKVHYEGAKDEPCEVIVYGTGPVTTTRVGMAK